MSSKFSKEANRMSNDIKEREALQLDDAVTNFMGGTSYTLDPIMTLKMVMSSGIIGEPRYYPSTVTTKLSTTRFEHDDVVEDSILAKYSSMDQITMMETIIDNALAYDFTAALNVAVELRNIYNMRLNPQIIMVRAAMHPNRIKYTKEYNGMFNVINQNVMLRADEPMAQLAYYIYLNEGKVNKIPSILKRSIAKRINKMKLYEINKYKNAEIGLINAVRITHANSEPINELMKTGTVVVSKTTDETWEQKRSKGMGWKEIVETTNLGHMAMLRNLRNVFTEVDDLNFCKKYLKKLEDGVIKGKQFPFRYYSAWNSIKTASQFNTIHHLELILNSIENCIDLSIQNMPKLKGRTAALSDNSGSAWGTHNSEYGTTTVATIDNLSSIIACMSSEDLGTMIKFGDKYIEYPITSHTSPLELTNKISNLKAYDVGSSTEGGIWKWFRDVIKNKVFYDNIFIFSDCQAGTGGLYGSYGDMLEYRDKYGMLESERYINVYKLVLEYRKQVNPEVNVFCVQTAGYDNVLLPDLAYRYAVLSGWTGNEVSFAKAYTDQWDEFKLNNPI